MGQKNLAVLRQRAKKVVSDSPGLVDFAIGLVNSVFNWPDRQVKFFEEFKLQKNCEINLLIKTFFGLVEMIFGLVNVSFSLPEWQAIKMTFFAPCRINGVAVLTSFFFYKKMHGGFAKWPKKVAVITR